MNLDSLFVPEFGNFVILLISSLALYLAYYVIVVSKRRKLPPGPTGVPLLGNLPQMVKNPHLKLSKWARQYGKVYTIYMANRATLVVNDAKWMKELFGTMASTGKFKTDTMMLISRGPYGIINTEGSEWNEQRQFCIRSLRELGFGKSSSMEPLILQEARELCAWIHSSSLANPQESLDIRHVLYQATVNALWVLVTGERIQFGDDKSYKLLSSVTEAAQYTMKTGLGFFPWLKYIAPKLSGYVDFDKACRSLHDFIGSKFEEHRKSYVEDQTRDLIDAYIEHMDKKTANNNSESSFFGSIGHHNSLSSVVEIFMAGTETTSTTMNWLSIYLSFNTEIQEELQDEIDQIVGLERDPTLLDRTMMPFTEAVILETLRLSSIFLFGVPHELLDDVPFQGYTLPKGLILMANMYHVHHDPQVWGDPEEFRPQRFLGDEGQRLKDHLVPFQAGKRQCLGETLARDILFLFVTKILQQFSLRPDPSISKDEYFKRDVGIILMPGCSKFVVSRR